MERIELKVDESARLIKVVRFIGAFLLGLSIGAIFLKYQYEGDVNWVASIIVLSIGIGFSLFPGSARKQRLSIDEDGVILFNPYVSWGQQKQIKWESITSIGVGKNTIKIKSRVGSVEEFKLPLFTKDQLSILRTYLKQLTDQKQIDYLN